MKPAYEPIIVARKPLDGTVAANVMKHGCGGINVDGCRIGTTVETWPASRSFASGISSGYTDGIAKGQTQSTGTAPAGRWPANFIHDGSEEVLRLFPETESGGGDKTNKGTRGVAVGGIYGNYEPNPNPKDHKLDSGSAARFFYTAKADSSERRRSKHPTVKPLDLMKYLVRLVCPAGGTVLDCFMGSGSTIEAAREEHCRAIGMDLSEEYCADAVERLRQGVLNFGEANR